MATIERLALAVTVIDPGDDTVPSWRDTIFVEVTGGLSGSELSSLKSQALAEGLARHSAWRKMVLDPPKPDPVDEPTALDQARDALAQAQDALSLASSAVESAQPVEVAAAPDGG